LEHVGIIDLMNYKNGLGNKIINLENQIKLLTFTQNEINDSYLEKDPSLEILYDTLFMKERTYY
jgi:hypothetical protein